MAIPGLFSLAPYLVRVRNVPERKYATLSAFDDDEHDLLDIATKYLTDLQREIADDENAQTVLRIPKVETEKRSVYGIIETGKYGLESVLYHRKKKQDVYKRSRDEADMSPFFFLLHVPKDVDEGILILQRIGAYGIRKVLYGILAPKFRKEFEDLRLRIYPLVLEKELRELLRGGRATQIRFCRFGLSPDIADHYEGGHQEAPGRTELVFYARRGDRFNFRQQLTKIIQGKSVSEVFALEDIDFDFDTVKVALEQNGRARQIDLSKVDRVRSYADVTASLKILGTGHPEFESIKAAGFDLLEQTKKQIYGRSGGP